jgi:ATP-dependent exoDNAse (exonuclease V) alpha subunit
VHEALWEHGHGGYTGTIAQKDGFVMAQGKPEGMRYLEYIVFLTRTGSARVTTGRSADLLTVVGNLLGAQPGESLRLQGRWTSHPQYGRQFEVHNYTTVLPATVQGLRRYLSSGLIKGIGPKMAERIVTHFDLDTLRVIEEEPQRLSEVPGLGPKRTAMIGRAWDLPGRVHLRRQERAIPPGGRRLGHRLQDGRQDRAVTRHPAR